MKLKMMNKLYIYLALILIMGLSSLAWAGENPFSVDGGVHPDKIRSNDEKEITQPYLRDSNSEMEAVKLNIYNIRHGILPEGARWARVYTEITTDDGGGLSGIAVVIEMAFKDSTKLYINTDGTDLFEVQDITGHEEGQ